MNCRLRVLLWTVLAWFAPITFAGTAEQAALDPHLEILRPLIGKTWRGMSTGSGSEKSTVDVATWERALNGTAIRVLHSVNDGVYGGETLIIWDEEKQSLTTHYFSTAGFRTTGTIKAADGKFTAEEEVKGDAGGITRVRAVMELLADGTLRIKSEYFKKDAWQPGREALYRDDPKAKVIFK